MRSKIVRALVLALLLCGAGLAQQPGTGGKGGKEGKKGPADAKSLPQIKQGKQGAPLDRSELEGMLTDALRYNPDIRVAAAKLDRARVEVTQKVVALHQEILLQRAMVDAAQRKYDRLASNAERLQTDPEKVEQAGVEITLAKARLDDLESKMMGLLGKTPIVGVEQQNSNAAEYNRSLDQLARESEMQRRQALNGARPAAFRGRLESPMAERLRKALQTPIKVDYKDVPVSQILKDLSKKVEGLSFHNMFDPLPQVPEHKYSVRFEDALPVSAILQALADESGCLFFVREYGILATRPDRAPRRAMTVEEFLRQ